MLVFLMFEFYYTNRFEIIHTAILLVRYHGIVCTSDSQIYMLMLNRRQLHVRYHSYSNFFFKRPNTCFSKMQWNKWKKVYFETQYVLVINFLMCRWSPLNLFIKSKEIFLSDKVLHHLTKIPLLLPFRQI